MLMLINVWVTEIKEKSQRPLGETKKTEKGGKQMRVRPHLCFQLITPSVHWQQKMIGGTEEAASLKWKFSPDSCLSYLRLRAHSAHK